MDNENVKQLHDLISGFKKNYEEDCDFAYVYLAIKEDFNLDKYSEQVSDYEHEFLDDIEYIHQTSGFSGDDFHGKLIRNIKGTDYCLVIEYSM